jgi:hypothetical protein
MSAYEHPVSGLILRRVSHRTYQPVPIPMPAQEKLRSYLGGLTRGPLGTHLRFILEAATEDDRSTLRGLGTYGFIRGNTGFIIGSMSPSAAGFEDFGFAMEQIVLLAADLGLGTCWLGGSFTRSSFAAHIGAGRTDRIPAVLAVGVVDKTPSMPNRSRFAWDRLFFQDDFDTPLTAEAAGPYADILELVRQAPSASNKQPWRIVRRGDRWHIFLQRTEGYRKNVVTLLLRIEDIQRVDIGIAMSHFELSAREAGLDGRWAFEDPGIETTAKGLEYRVTWRPG